MKILTQNNMKDYVVHIRSKPKKGWDSEIIKMYLILCDPKDLYENIAILETFLTVSDESEHPKNYWAVQIDRIDFSSKKLGPFYNLSDGDSGLNKEEREKIDKFHPMISGANKDVLERIVKKHYTELPGEYYI